MALYQVPTQNALQYTLDSQLSAGDTTSLTLNQSVAGIVRAPGVLVVDRIDSGNNETASKREYITFTGVSSAQLTGLSRGLAGSSDQVHSVGAIVEFVPDVLWAQALYDFSLAEHTGTGVHASLASVSYLKSAVYNASGASLQGFPVRPTWFISGNVSAATTSLGRPTPMPVSGTIDFVSAALRSPVSGASLILDINKNFGSIFEAGTRPSILGGGTFVSTASINTKAFNAGDILSVDVDAGGNYSDITVVVSAR